MTQKKNPPLHATVGATGIRVKFKGVVERDCLEADVLGCWIIRYARDKAGNLLRDKNLDGEEYVLTEKLYGHVEIEFLDPVADDPDLNYAAHVWSGF